MTEATVQTRGLLPVGLSPAVNGHQATTGVVSVQPTEVSVPFSGTGQRWQIPCRGSPATSICREFWTWARSNPRAILQKGGGFLRGLGRPSQIPAPSSSTGTLDEETKFFLRQSGRHKIQSQHQDRHQQSSIHQGIAGVSDKRDIQKGEHGWRDGWLDRDTCCQAGGLNST